MKLSTEIARPFLPAKDFGLSKRFYEALGFAQVLDAADVAIFRIGPSSFVLKGIFKRSVAENFMMQLMVDDLDAWWNSHCVAGSAQELLGVASAESPGTSALGLAIRLRCRPINACSGTWRSAAVKCRG